MYKVRQPGMSYFSEVADLREARADLRRARLIGLTNAAIYEDTEDGGAQIVDVETYDPGEVTDAVLGAQARNAHYAAEDARCRVVIMTPSGRILGDSAQPLPVEAE